MLDAGKVLDILLCRLASAVGEKGEHERLCKCQIRSAEPLAGRDIEYVVYKKTAKTLFRDGLLLVRKLNVARYAFIGNTAFINNL